MAVTPRPLKPLPDLMVLKVELERITPAVWRRVVVPETITLGKLHRVIQAVMGWGDVHLHEYEIAGERYGTPEPDSWGDPIHSEIRKTLVKALQGRKTFRYVYDFGDCWEHKIKVEKSMPYIQCPQMPYCIDGANACPPEDVGGEGGYADFLEAMGSSNHPEHQEMLARLAISDQVIRAQPRSRMPMRLTECARSWSCE